MALHFHCMLRCNFRFGRMLYSQAHCMQKPSFAVWSFWPSVCCSFRSPARGFLYKRIFQRNAL